MKILFTGGSSFTGYWFIRELSAAGHEVTAVYTASDPESYSGIRKQRVMLLKNVSQQVFGCPFGSKKFLSLAASEKFNLLCHHAAEVKDYKNPDFNSVRALELNTRNLASVLKKINKSGFQGIILTGSVFEAQEGKGGNEGSYLDAFSPYGLSKSLTFSYFKYYCSAFNIKLGKFVIPNPFGPYEEPRFTGYLIKTWLENKTAEVNTPLYIRDNIHADLLAGTYLYFINRMVSSPELFLKLNPGLYAEPMGMFTMRFAQEMRSRIDHSCEFKLNEQTSFTEPIERINTDPAAELIKEWNEKAAWDNLADYYNTMRP